MSTNEQVDKQTVVYLQNEIDNYLATRRTDICNDNDEFQTKKPGQKKEHILYKSIYITFQKMQTNPQQQKIDQWLFGNGGKEG